MAIIRVEKNKNYTTMSNYHLRDKNLSLKAKGLLSMMLALPEDWDYSVKGLEKICVESVNTINGIIHELEQMNYMQRKKIYENGKIKDWEYVIYEEPNLYLKNQDIENVDIENLDIENCTQLNTNNQLNKQINNNKEKENIKETEIFDYWNSKDIIKHSNINLHLKAIQKALKVYTLEQIKTYIDRYDKIIKDKTYFFDYKWTLTDFLNRKDGISSFADDGSKWVNYLNRESKPQKQGYQKPQQHQHLVIDHEQLNKDYAKFVGTYIGGDE